MIQVEDEFHYERVLVIRFIKFWIWVRCGKSIHRETDEVAKWGLESAFLDIYGYLKKKGLSDLVDPELVTAQEGMFDEHGNRRAYH